MEQLARRDPVAHRGPLARLVRRVLPEPLVRQAPPGRKGRLARRARRAPLAQPEPSAPRGRRGPWVRTGTIKAATALLPPTARPTRCRSRVHGTAASAA